MKCPFCGTELEVTEEHAGLVVQCPSCSDYFKIPALQRCPGCGDVQFGKRKICVKCGWSFERNSPLGTEISEEAPAPLAARMLQSLADNMPGLFRWKTLIGFALSLAIALGVGGIGLVTLGLGAFVSAIFVLAAGYMVYLQGLAFLCTGELCLLRSAYQEMTGSCWSCFLTLAFMPLLAAALIVAGVLQNA